MLFHIFNLWKFVDFCNFDSKIVQKNILIQNILST